jgi:hypothetical protein
MAPPHTQRSPQRKGRVLLAIDGIKKKQFPSRRGAARVFRVSETTVRRHQKGTRFQVDAQLKNRLLWPVEEEELIK